MDAINKFGGKLSGLVDTLEKDLDKSEISGGKLDELLAKGTVDAFNKLLKIGRRLYLEVGDKGLMAGIRETEPKSLKFTTAEYYNLLTGQFNPNLVTKFLINKKGDLTDIGRKFRQGMLTGAKGKQDIIRLYYTLDYYYYQPVSDVVRIKNLIDYQGRVLTFEDSFDAKKKIQTGEYDSTQTRTVKTKMVLKVKNGEQNVYSYFYKVKNILERMMRQIYT